jgi:hypothetical protein
MLKAKTFPARRRFQIRTHNTDKLHTTAFRNGRSREPKAPEQALRRMRLRMPEQSVQDNHNRGRCIGSLFCQHCYEVECSVGPFK